MFWRLMASEMARRTLASESTGSLLLTVMK